MQAQAAAFAASLALGVLYGVLYDIVRFLRVLFFIDVRPPPGRPEYLRRYLVPVADLLFLVWSGGRASVFFFVTGDGRVRGFVLVGAFCGFLAYYHTVGRLFITVVAAAAAAVRRAMCAVFRLVKKPFAALFRLLCGAAQKIAKPVASRARTWYNRKKEEKAERQRYRMRRARMARCGDVCTNGTEDGKHAKNRTGAHAVFGAGGTHRRADPRSSSRRFYLVAAERPAREK